MYLLGEGGMGQVFHATDPDLSRELAVKVLLDDVRDEASRARFHNEMKALTRIGSHPGVVQFYSKESTPRGDDVMVMAFIDGGTLAHAIKDRARTGRGFSVNEVVYYLKPIASALDYMHHELHPGWVHRDVKPANILLRKRPGSLPPAVLTDFGISIQEGQSRLTKIGHIVGTEKYLAPENNGRAYGDDDLSARADDYALALIAFEMLTLHHLKDTMPRSEWIGERRLPDLTSAAFADYLAPETARVASHVQKALDKALDGVPMRRYATAQEFISALDKAASSTSSPAALPRQHVPTPEDQSQPRPEARVTPPSQPEQQSPLPRISQQQQQLWPEPSRPTEHNRPTGFFTPANPISSTEHIDPSTPVTPAVPSGSRIPDKKDNTNALFIAATVVVIFLIFLVTWAVVA